MHTHRRLVILTVLCAALLPVFGGMQLLGDLGGATREEFLAMIEQARATYRDRSGTAALERASVRSLEDNLARLPKIAQQKRYVRLQIATLRQSLQGLRNHADALVQDRARAQQLFQAQRQTLAAFARDIDIRGLLQPAQTRAAQIILRRVAVASLGDETDAFLRDAALTQSREQILVSLLQAQEGASLSEALLRDAAGDTAAQLADLEQQHEELRVTYLATSQAIDRAQSIIIHSEADLKEIRYELARVHRDVLALQSELARIDARIRSKAERALIEKGLLDPVTETGGRSARERGLFAWPVHGSLSAGFHDPNYRKIMGVAHEGQDIAVPQGTPVQSAADGIVFIVREGGLTGYTYVLIGHRDGYATLYGHLSAVQVTAGQEVKQGEVIGLSGATPGTPGAGPLTTGPHLHFEVLQQGQNIDPLSVLP